MQGITGSEPGKCNENILGTSHGSDKVPAKMSHNLIFRRFSPIFRIFQPSKG